MKNKLVFGIFLLLTLTASSVFASMVENSRQGSPAISAISHPETSTLEQRSHLGFELRFLGFCIRSGIIYTDPFGQYWVGRWGIYLRTYLDFWGASKNWFSSGYSGIKAVARADEYTYEKFWIPEPPCFFSFPPYAGEATRYEVVTLPNLLVSMVPKLIETTTNPAERAEVFSSPIYFYRDGSGRPFSPFRENPVPHCSITLP
jgi:hypothetical protein